MATNLPIGGTQIDSLPSKTAVQDSDKLPISRDGSAASITVADFNNKTNGVVGDAFDTDKTYSAGDYCIYNDTLYKFTASKDIGAWDDSIVEATDVTSEIKENTDLIDSLLYIESYTSESYTVTVGEYADWTENVSKSGYTILGIVQYYTDGTSASYCAPYRVRINGSNLRFAVRNFGSSTATITLNATILYQKNS